MIFKTITDKTTLSGQRVISVLQARKIAQAETNTSIQKYTTQLELDKTALTQLENKIKSGISYEEAYSQSMKKASIAAKEYAIYTKGSAGTMDTFVAKQKVMQSELKATSTSLNLLSICIKTLSTAFNIFTNLTITWGINKIIEGFEYLAKSAERAKEKAEEIQTELSDKQFSYENNRKTLLSLQNEYNTLSKKAETLGGAQNLTNNEYERYKDIISQILSITPKLATGWNDESTAIFNKNNLLQMSIDLLDKEHEKILRNNTTKSKNKAVASGIITKLDQFNNDTDTKTKSNSTYELYTDFFYELKNINKTTKLNDYNIAKSIYDYLYPNGKGLSFPIGKFDWIDMLEKEILKNKDYDKLAKSFSDKKNPIYNLFSDETIDQMIRNADAYFEEEQRIIDDREALYQEYKDQLNWNAQAAIDKNGNNAYKQLSNNGMAFINELIDGFDYEKIKSADDFAIIANDIQKFTQLLASNDNVAKLAEEIFTPIKEDETSTEYAKRVKNAITNLQKYCKDNYINLPIKLATLDNANDLETQYQNAINSSKEKFSGYDPTAFFQKHSINTQEEIDKWNEIVKNTKNAKEAEKEYLENLSNDTTTSTTLSFQESWDSLDTTGSDDTKQATQEAKEQLLELAEAGKLTAEELQKSPAGKTIMEQTKLSAEEATEAVNELAGKSSQLSSMKSGIQSISSVLAQKQENLENSKTKTTGIDSSTLSGFDASIKGLDSWKQFEKTLGNGKSSMKDCQQAANKLATEWVNSNNFLSQLDDTNKKYYISQLKEMGVENARSIVTDIINQKKTEEAQKEREIALEKEYNKQSSIDLTQADCKQIDALGKFVGWTDETKEALYRLALQKRLTNGTTLDFSSDLDTIIDFGDKLGYSTKKLKQYRQVLSGSGGSAGMPSDVAEKLYGEPAKKEYENIINDKKKKKKKKVKIKVDPSSDPTEENPDDETNIPTETKETKQSFDWLERRISVLTNKLDLLKAKIENVFNVQQKNSILDDEIKKTNTLINTYKKQEKTYKAQAKKSAKSKKTATDEAKLKLTGKKGKQLIKQIQTGQIKGSKKQWIKAYNAKTVNAIEEYQDYWDKYQTAKKNRQDAIKSRRELKIQKRQNWVDYYDSIGSQYDAQIENAATAKAKKKLEEDKLKYVERSYNQQIKIAKLEEDSVKASTLLAQKWKEIADSRERILQYHLDENANKRDYNNAAYENADNAGKKSLIQGNINAYNADNQAYTENVQSAQKNVNTANANISKSAKAATTRLKKESIDSKIVKEINGYLNSGKKVPDKYMKMAEHTYPTLYQKLAAYNNSIDAAEVARGALAEAQKNQKKAQEENKTAIREEQSKSIQLDIDTATNKKDKLAAEYENLTSADAKNKNIDEQLQQQKIIHERTLDQINNDIIDPIERKTALDKEDAEWITAQREQTVLKLQNLSDEQSAQYDLNQQKETNADTAKEKNQYEAQSRENLKAQYAYEIQIAETNGNLVEAERQRLELEQKIEESYQKQIDNIREEYDLILGMNNAKKSTIESQIAALQANGYGVGTELYEQQKKLLQDNYKQSLEELKRISAELPNLTENALKQAEIDLETEKQNVWAIQESLGEIQQTINDTNLAKIERIGTMLQYSAENLEHIQNILSHSDFTLSDKDIGGLTMEGLANAAVTLAQMSNNTEQIANLYDQIAEKRRQLESTENVDDYDQITEDIENLIQQANELEEANYDFGESIKDLVVESLNSLSDALDESISKYKDALQAQKDLYDYRQKVAGQLKTIASLEKQLAALQGSDTEEARARIQKLQVELEDERQNLKDTEYDKYIQDQEEMLDKISDDFQDFIANVTNMSVSKICAAMNTAVTDNLDAIGKSIASSFYELSLINGIASDTNNNGLGEMLDNLDYEGKVTAGVDGNGNVHYKYTDDKNNKTDITADNQDAPGTIIGVTVNGEDVTPADKEVVQTGNKIEAAVHGSSTGGNNTLGSKDDHAKDSAGAGDIDGNKQLKRSIEGYIETLNSYVSDSDAGMSLSVDPLNQFLYTEHGKMATSFQKYQILKKLGLLQNGWGDETNRTILGQAVEKLQHLGFSQGGIATYLNRIALANGDDGWATLKRGESVLTQAQTEQFQKLTNNLVPLNTIAEAITSLSANPAPVNHSPAATTTTVRNVDIHLDGSHVMDADSFIQTLHNPKVLQEISSGVSSQLGNVMSNKLGSF